MTYKLKFGLLSKIFGILFLSTVFIQIILIFPLTGPGERQRLPDLIAWHMTQYMTLLVEKIGDPKDPYNSAKVSEQFDSEIRIENRDGSVILGNSLPSYADVSQGKGSAIIGMFLNVPIGNFDGRLYYGHQTHDYNYVFSPRHLKIPTMINRAIRFFVLFTFLPAILSFFLIRIILRPIRTLKAAVDRFGSGDLKARASIHQNDELGALADNFNRMADEINNVLTARQQLVSDVSHELRSPIARLKMAVETTPMSQIKQDLLDDINELQSLTDTILDAERIRSGVSAPTLEDCNIVSIIHEVKKQIRTSHKILTEELPEAINVITDRRWAKIVIRNVVENAIKYSHPEARPIEISADSRGEFCDICVKDFGVGIDQKDLEKVFEPFYRVDSSRTKSSGGFGIGLHLCKRMMTALGGSIQIESSKGEWTKVTLRFLV